MTFKTGRTSRFLLIIITAFFAWAGCSTSKEDVLANADEYLKTGNIAAARESYQSILEKNPYDSESLQGMINTTRLDENIEEHTQWCKRLLQIRPWDRYANVIAGKQLLAQGNLTDAANRLLLAYLEADFAKDKREIMALFENIRAQEKLIKLPPKEKQNAPIQQAPQH